MSKGAIDSNGIYQYGEDDNASPFSTLLNLLASTVSTAVGTIIGQIGTLNTSVTSLTNRQRTTSGITGTVATDTSGEAKVAHGLGKVPSSVQITNMPGGTIPGNRTIALVSVSETEFRIRVYRQDQTAGSTLNSNPVQFAWAAHG